MAGNRKIISLGRIKVGATITLLLLVIYYISPLFLNRLELIAIDTRFKNAGTRKPGGEVAIAAIDEKSIDMLGRWPWPRYIVAQLLDSLTEYGAKVVGFDIVFSSPDKSSGIDNLLKMRDIMKDRSILDPQMSAVMDKEIEESDYDGKLARAIRRSRKIVLGYFFHFSRKGLEHLKEEEMSRYLRNISKSKYNGIKKAAGSSLRSIRMRKAYAVESNIEEISRTTKRAGYFNFYPDIDGAVRKVPLIIQYRNMVEIPDQQDYLFPPLSITVLRKYLRAPIIFWIEKKGIDKVAFLGRKPIVIPTDRIGSMLINYLGPQRTFPHYSIVDIINRKLPKDALKGKIVLVGPTATALEDIRITPFDKAFPGVEVHANIIDNILHNDFLTKPRRAWFVDSVTIIVIGLILTLLIPQLRVTGGALITIILATLYIFGNQYLFTHKHILINVIYPILSFALLYASFTVYGFLTEEKQKRYIRSAFNQYLSPAIIEELINDPSKLKLGGERRELTAFFSDIQGFSTISETLRPEELVALLNDYLTDMTDIIMTYDGTVDKFEGDAIIAFFGAPISYEDHAIRACNAAIDMQKSLAEMREACAKDGRPILKMRIGLNTGPMVVGNMGSKNRMDYTMMGDSVNLAARLEGVNKQYGTFTMISEFTYNQAKSAIEARELDRIRVVGKKEPVVVYELLGKKDEVEPQIMRVTKIFEEGLSFYKKREWDNAVGRFKDAIKVGTGDVPSRRYIDRCIDFKNSPPPKDWDGVYEMKVK